MTSTTPPTTTGAEHRIEEPPKDIISRTVSGWGVAVGGFILGGVISVFGNEIRFATKLFILGHAEVQRLDSHGVSRAITMLRGDLDAGVLVFWLIMAAWIVVLGLRLSAEDKQETNRVMQLLRAIHRTPNLNVLRQYPAYYFSTAYGALVRPPKTAAPEERAKALAECIQAALLVVGEMAKEFARADTARYGANVMLLIDPEDFPDALLPTLRFHEPGNLKVLKFIAHLPRELCAQHVGEGGNVQTPLISLPVPRNEFDRFNNRLPLPGAPTAVMSNGGGSVEEDTHSMAAQCRHLGPVSNEVAEYFSEKGDGRDIKSLASFRIGPKDAPVGVLNIDSSEPNVLGREQEFYITFHALLSPMLELLRPVVLEFAQLYWPSQPTSIPPDAAGGVAGRA